MNSSTTVLGTLTSADLENLATRTIDQSDSSVQNVMGDFLVPKTPPAQKKTDHEMTLARTLDEYQKSVPLKLEVNNLFPKSWLNCTEYSPNKEGFDRYIYKSEEAFDAGYKTRHEAELRKRYPQVPIVPMSLKTSPVTENNFSVETNECETCFSCFPIWNEYLQSLYK